MSYFNMNHVEWMEGSIRAEKRTFKGRVKKDKRGQPIGLASAPDELTPAQRRAVTILGIVGYGIYNARVNWDTSDWLGGLGLSVSWRDPLSTYDADDLTLLVLLSHYGRMRCNISSPCHSLLRITLTQRTDRKGMYNRHPNLEDAIFDIADRMGAFKHGTGQSHPVVYDSPFGQYLLGPNFPIKGAQDKVA